MIVTRTQISSFVAAGSRRSITGSAARHCAKLANRPGPATSELGQTETTPESRGMSASPHWPSKAVQPLPAKLGYS